ncbi:hypothetical protein [Colwellia sp. MEBiC06753]
MNILLYLVACSILLFAPFAFAANPDALMVLFIPGFVFILVGSFAITYALSANINNYWLKLFLRILSITIISASIQVGGADYWWPTGIALFFGEHINLAYPATFAIGLSMILVFMWWLVKNQSKV